MACARARLADITNPVRAAAAGSGAGGSGEARHSRGLGRRGPLCQGKKAAPLSFAELAPALERTIREIAAAKGRGFREALEAMPAPECRTSPEGGKKSG